ncbi:MAG: methyltransferase domain-containing protein [Myxococcota bacterium]
MTRSPQDRRVRGERARLAAETTLGEAVTCDAITTDYRILQRARGHRYSLDDLATAAEAVRGGLPPGLRYLDLGCGIGSALLMVAWRLRPSVVVGIEALGVSVALARMNAALNDLDADIVEGDHRVVTTAWRGAPFDLITGTPPYLPVGTAIASPDPQRAAARLEIRGGVEDYLLSARRVLAEGGRVVVCAGGGDAGRVEAGARAASLQRKRRVDVFPHVDARGPLFSVWTLGEGDDAAPHDHKQWWIRGGDGTQTAAARGLRATFGLSPGPKG